MNWLESCTWLCRYFFVLMIEIYSSKSSSSDSVDEWS